MNQVLHEESAAVEAIPAGRRDRETKIKLYANL
jgi:hypothetical protein